LKSATGNWPPGMCRSCLVLWGIHKIVLGYTEIGAIMLAVSALTCGVAGFVMGVIGLIEGVIYLTKTHEEFKRISIDGTREWF
jgi:hypothetical protein